MFGSFTHEIDKIISLPKSMNHLREQFCLKLCVPEKPQKNNVSGTFSEDSLTCPLSKTELRYPVIVPCSKNIKSTRDARDLAQNVPRNA